MMDMYIYIHIALVYRGDMFLLVVPKIDPICFGKT